MYQPKTGVRCSCKPGLQRDNCQNCEGTGFVIDFKKIREKVSPMKKLLNAYGFESISEYFQMILESLVNGQIKQAGDQFKAMPQKERLDFLTDTEVRLTERQKEAFKLLMLEFPKR